MIADKYRSIVFLVAVIFLLQACDSMKIPSLSDMSNLTSPTQFFKRHSADAENKTDDQTSVQQDIDLSLPVLQCEMREGTANFADKWYDFKTVSFNIRQKQHQKVTIPRKWGKETTPISAHFEDGGQKLILCADHSGESDKILCASLYALEDDFIHGVKRTLDIPEAVRGGVIKCKYKS